MDVDGSLALDKDKFRADLGTIWMHAFSRHHVCVGQQESFSFFLK